MPTVLTGGAGCRGASSPPHRKCRSRRRPRPSGQVHAAREQTRDTGTRRASHPRPTRSSRSPPASNSPPPSNPTVGGYSHSPDAPVSAIITIAGAGAGAGASGGTLCCVRSAAWEASVRLACEPQRYASDAQDMMIGTGAAQEWVICRLSVTARRRVTSVARALEIAAVTSHWQCKSYLSSWPEHLAVVSAVLRSWFVWYIGPARRYQLNTTSCRPGPSLWGQAMLSSRPVAGHAITPQGEHAKLAVLVSVLPPPSPEYRRPGNAA